MDRAREYDLPEEWKSITGASEACVECRKGFTPGDELTSALYQEGDGFVRRDLCPSCWEARGGGDHFSFWRRVVPEPEDEEARKKRRLEAMLNPLVLFDIFKEMADHPDAARRRFRFMLALMLMRRKKLRFISIGKRKMADGEQDVLMLKQAGRGARLTFDVVDVKMGEEEMIAAQDEVEKVLAMGGVDLALSQAGPGEGQAEEEHEGAPVTGEARGENAPRAEAPGEATAPSGDAEPGAQQDEGAAGDASGSAEGP
ncbi:MAG: hypothetical protein ACYSU0_13115 [Planctomycetota bacterium]